MYIDDGLEQDVERYDLASDPGERLDLTSTLRVRAEAFDIRLAKILALRALPRRLESGCVSGHAPAQRWSRASPVSHHRFARGRHP